MSSTAFPYFIQIDTRRRFSIIRFPNDRNLVPALNEFAQTLPADEFYSLTRTSREISVIQDAKYPAYPQGLAEELLPLVQVEEGFVLLEVVPDGADQIDFSVTGLLARLATILAQKEIPIFAISTFDTDYILIRGVDVTKAVEGFQKEAIQVEVWQSNLPNLPGTM